MSEHELRAPHIQAPSDSLAATRVHNGSESGSSSREWIYKKFCVGRKQFWFASPTVQLLIVSLVCFLCPGMFNALGGLGGGGLDDPKAQDHANTALYATFSIVGFFAGTFVNKLGIKSTLSIGGLGYCIYAASFFCYAHTSNVGFVVFAGALLGVCAGLLWTAQGAIMMSYPLERNKGKFISWFWMIFNLGAVIGSLIPLAQNIHNASGTVTDGTYAAFVALMLCGAILALTLCEAGNVVREDGSRVILRKNPTWGSEFRGLLYTLIHDPWIILLFPMFWSSNVFYTYQFNGFNGAGFNVRTRALNGLLYWLAQIIGAWLFGYGLDYPGFSRQLRARLCLIALFVMTFAVWGGGYIWQRRQPPRSVLESPAYKGHIDWSDSSKFIGAVFLFMSYGFYDACWQTGIYWLMGAMTNSGRTTANLAGFYKGIQSAGAAVFWRLDGLRMDYTVMLLATWGLLAASLLIAAPVIWLKIKDTTHIGNDLAGTGATIEEVKGTSGSPKTNNDV